MQLINLASRIYSDHSVFDEEHRAKVVSVVAYGVTRQDRVRYLKMAENVVLHVCTDLLNPDSSPSNNRQRRDVSLAYVNLEERILPCTSSFHVTKGSDCIIDRRLTAVSVKVKQREYRCPLEVSTVRLRRAWLQGSS